MRRTLTAIFVATLFATPAFAATRTWTGAIDANWSNPGNWSPPGVPAAADDLEFPGLQDESDDPPESVIFDLPDGTSVGTMAFLGNYVVSGNLMTLTGDLGFLSSPSAVEVVFDNDLRLGSSLRFSGPFRVTFNGGIDVNGHTLTMGTTFNTLLKGPLTGSGTIVVEPRGVALLGSGTFSGTVQGNAFVAGPYPNVAAFDSPWLTGTGTIGPATAGRLSPGEWLPGLYADPHTLGTMRTGPLSITTQYSVDIVPGAAHDQVKVSGTVSVAGTLAVTIPSGTSPLPGSSYTIVDNDGSDAVSGTFAGLPEGAAFPVGSTQFVITYRGGDGNDVVLHAGNGVKTWIGYTSENWSDPSNWSPPTVPAAGEPLLFPACCGSRAESRNDLPSFSPGLLSFHGEYTLNGNELTLTDNLHFAYGNNQLVYFTCDAPLKLGSSIRFNPSTRQIYNGAIDVSGHTLTIETVDTMINGAIHGTGAIAVNGKGLAIRSSGTFTGSITGIVDLVGSYPGAAVTGARVSGDGTLGAVTAGTLAPGVWHPAVPASTATGTLETGPLSVSTKLAVNLAPGSTSDQVRVTGTVSVAGTLDVKIVSGTPAEGQTFVIIDNDGTDAVSGTFTGLPEGATLTAGTTELRISYQGGDGNDVVLAVPGDDRSTSTTIAQDRATSHRHEPVTFTATVTASAGGVPAGLVAFYDGAEAIGSAPLANGVAELTVSTLSVGTHQISAMYEGSDALDASTSAPVLHEVVKKNPNLSITSSSPTSTYGDPVSFAIAVAGSPTPAGTVTVTIDAVASITATLAANGTATVAIPMIPAGVHLVTAGYSGDATYDTATRTITQTVLKAPTVVALDSVVNPSPVGVPVTVSIEVSPAAHRNMPVSGDVIVANGGQKVTEAQLIANAAVVRVGPFRGGEYTITATYEGNQNFETAAATLTQRVAQPAVVVPETSVAERNGAFEEAVRVELTEAAAWPVTVEYRTVDGTARANVDYAGAQGTIVFNPGQTAAAIPIRILGDTSIETDETFEIRLSNPAGAALADDRVLFVIANDDLSHLPPVSHSIATNDGATVRATFYAPAASEGPWPVIVWVPGRTAYDGAGGDVAALRETARGYAVLNVAYRSPAKAPFPAQVLDLMAAVRWLRANAVTLNIDANRIAAWGTGAGGHLAVLLGTGIDGTDADSRVSAVVAWGAIADLSSLQADASRCSTTNWNAAGSPASQLIGCPVQQCPEAADAASPARHAGRGDAPVLLMHGRADCFVAPRQSERLYEALQRAGVDATLRIIDFAGHDDAYWTSADAFAEAGAFLDGKLKGGSGRRRAVRR